MASPGHLVRRFLGSLVPFPPREVDVAWVAVQLTPEELAVWQRMSRPDRRHSIAVARRLPVDGGTAWDDPKIRQRLSQLYIDCQAMKYTRYRALTRQIRG